MGTSTTTPRRHDRPTTAGDGVVHRAAAPVAVTAPMDGVWDAVETIALARFVDRETFAVETQLKGVDALADIAPEGLTTHTLVTDQTEKWLIGGDGWTFMGRRDRDGDVFVIVTATTAAARDALLAEIRSRVPPVVVDDVDIPIAFWFCEQRPRVSHRRVAAPPWDDISRNYPRAVRDRIGSVMALDRPAGIGRLLLWHGPPGTGKTTAARALARSWSDWCRTTVVVEPERLFASAGMIFDLTTADPDDDEIDGPSPWNLLIVEDADELLRADARSASGQALSRLLNLADGFMGQGLEVLILLSTNERLGGLHPAVSRPGRCLSQIEFPRFGATEAGEWLGAAPGTAAPDYSLAELVRLRDGGEDAGLLAGAASGVGQYL